MQEQFYKNKYFYTDNREKIKQKLYLSRDKSYRISDISQTVLKNVSFSLRGVTYPGTVFREYLRENEFSQTI